MQNQEILNKVRVLYKMWKDGMLGGEKMPEDSNPHFEKDSAENFLYFTLPMALNYQRNSYKLWESALETYKDEETKFVFDIQMVLKTDPEKVKKALVKHKVALQPNKQTEIWVKLCKTIKEHFCGDLRNLFKICENSVAKVKEYVHVIYKKDFPYLSGNKICNYWLFVLYQYTNIKYTDLQNLTVAPDTHVIKASKQLKLISEQEFQRSDVQQIVVERWEELLSDSEFFPIDIHTPLWLWSRGGFVDVK